MVFNLKIIISYTHHTKVYLLELFSELVKKKRIIFGNSVES